MYASIQRKLPEYNSVKPSLLHFSQLKGYSLIGVQAMQLVVQMNLQVLLYLLSQLVQRFNQRHIAILEARILAEFLLANYLGEFEGRDVLRGLKSLHLKTPADKACHLFQITLPARH
jgi:hypothetical protein